MKQTTIVNRNWLRYWAGQLLAACLPERRDRQILAFTIPNPDGETRTPIADRLIRYYLGHRHLDDPKTLEAMHRGFWQSQTPSDWYRLGAARHQSTHVPLFGPIFLSLRDNLRDKGIRSVREFGCGDGRWLAWLAKHWPEVDDFVGIDLSAAQIEINRQRFPSLRFEACELVEWAQSHAIGRCLYLTHCGVLEYLSQDSIDRLLSTLAAQSPGSLIAFVEPVDADMDLDLPDLPSRPHGDEFSWSHHYPARLRAAGCRIELQREVPMDHFRMLVVVASTPD